MTEDTQTPGPEAAEGAEAPAAEPDPIGVSPFPEVIKIRIGPVRMFTECTLKKGGCKALTMGMGNSFPVDHHHKNLQKPIAMACSACLQKMQRDGVWVVP